MDPSVRHPNFVFEHNVPSAPVSFGIHEAIVCWKSTERGLKLD